jgi:glycerophosphoryl diester phosphodiesterase
MVLFILVTAVLVLLLILVVFAVLRRDEALAIGSEWPRNVAHRGASDISPENTLEAFRRARQVGAGGLELDVHLSSDGHVVVIHDESLGRTTDGFGAVRDRTLQELRSLDTGYGFVPGGIPELGSPEEREVAGGGERHPYRGTGVRIPTLREVLEEFPEMTVNLDIKEATPGIEQAVLDEIDRAGARDRVLVASQDGAVISRFRILSGEGEGGRVATAASKWEVARFLALSRLRLEGLSNPPYQALQIPVEYGGVQFATERFVQAAHSRGVRVDVWTVDDPREMRRTLDLGADSVMTNRPGELERVLEPE